MTSFVNGDAIEYQCNEKSWKSGAYVGSCPSNPDYHVLQNGQGDFITRAKLHIRHPKVKMIGWIAIVNGLPIAKGIYSTTNTRPTEKMCKDDFPDAVAHIQIEWEQ